MVSPMVAGSQKKQSTNVDPIDSTLDPRPEHSTNPSISLQLCSPCHRRSHWRKGVNYWEWWQDGGTVIMLMMVIFIMSWNIYIHVDNMLIYVMIYVMIYVDNGYEYVDHWWYSMMKSFIYHFQISQKGFSETTNPLVIHCYLETETQLGRGAAPPCLVWPSESFDAVRWASCDSHRLHWRANKRVKHGETRRAPGRVTIDV